MVGRWLRLCFGCLVVLTPTSLSGGILNTLLSSTLTKAVEPQEIGGILGLSASVESSTRIIAPILGGALLEKFGTWSPGAFGAFVMVGVTIYVVTKILNHPIVISLQEQKFRSSSCCDKRLICGEKMDIRIVTDSTCDLPEELIAKYDITIVPLHIQQGGNSYLDGVDLTREQFYAQLPGFNPSPTTAAPGPDVFKEAWNNLADKGAKAILSIHISESLSATINSARIAAEQFTRIPVTVLDSSQLSLGMGFIVEKAAQMSQAGKKMEEIVSSLSEVMKRTYVFASLHTLEYLRRSGRMHFALARFGELLQIKPLLHMNQGKPVAHRTRTHRRANERLLEWLKEYSPYERLPSYMQASPKKPGPCLKPSGNSCQMAMMFQSYRSHLS